jgi:hypothetical protein
VRRVETGLGEFLDFLVVAGDADQMGNGASFSSIPDDFAAPGTNNSEHKQAALWYVGKKRGAAEPCSYSRP